jgi:hypothetical protein
VKAPAAPSFGNVKNAVRRLNSNELRSPELLCGALQYKLAREYEFMTAR